MSSLVRRLPGGEPGLATQNRREGIRLVIAMVGVMWVVEVINSIDSQGLDRDGIIPRNVSHLWGIFTAPFLHAGFGHLIGNTIPLVFLGLIIALRGAARVAAVSAIVIVLGGLGTWLIAPSGSVTLGASGLVFGYATYLLSRGFFDRSLLELAIGAVVFLVWGGALLISLLPHYGVSWQGHLFGGIAGVVAAWVLSTRDGHGRAADLRSAPSLPV
jgi:membrane associated rhomboid family serine protease